MSEASSTLMHLTPDDWRLLTQRMLDAVEAGRALPLAEARAAIGEGRAVAYFASRLGLGLGWAEGKQVEASQVMAQVSPEAERIAVRYGVRDDGASLGVAHALQAMRAMLAARAMPVPAPPPRPFPWPCP